MTGGDDSRGSQQSEVGMKINSTLDIEAYDSTKSRWSRWVERLEMALEIIGAAANKRKVMLLHYMGQEAYNVLCDKIAPHKPTDKTYEEIVKSMKEYYEPEPLEIVENYRFHLRKQKEGESVNEFVVALRKLSIHCNFGEYLDTALRNQFVFGIRTPKIQNRLLEAKSLTLTKAIDTATAMELSERGGIELHKEGPGSVNLITHRQRKPPKKASPPSSNKFVEKSTEGRAKAASPGTKCYRCGLENHLANKCRYRKAVCSRCQVVGHLRRVCMKKEGSSTNAIIAEVVDDLYNLDGSPTNDKFVINLDVNQIPIPFELDTGAPVTIMNRADATRYLGNLQLQPTDRRLSSYCGTEIAVHGQMEVKVSSGRDEKRLKLYVVESTKPPLLGRDWLRCLKLNWPEIISAREAVHSIQAPDNTPTQLKGILDSHSNVFEDSMGKIEGVQARLPLKPNAQPVFIKARRIPFAIKEAVEKELADLVSHGVLVKVDSSEWATPIVPVRKQGNKVRLCGDYKISVNPNLTIEEHPLPTIEELFTSMAGGQKFSKIDLSKAYLQMQVHPEDQEVLTVNTHKGLYRPTRLMYGVASAPAKFQREIENVLADIDGVSAFIDDIKITAPDDHTHLKRLDEVLRRLSKLNMRVNLKKCEFLADRIEYCGYQIDHRGIHKMNDKVQAIRGMKTPTSKEEIRSFIGLVQYYGRFIRNLSTVLHPLNYQTKEAVTFQWNTECQKSFQEVKRLMASNEVLAHYDPTLPLILATDASPYGVGAVLSHRYPDNTERPIQYASQTLSDVQRRYSQIDREAYAVVFGIKKFYQYVYGRKFILVTDNKPVKQIFSPQKGLPTLSATRMQHYAIFLESFEFDIEYRKSADNANADALSRLPEPAMSSGMEESDAVEIHIIESMPVTVEELSKETEKEPEVSVLINALKHGRRCEAAHRFGIEQTEFGLQQGCLMRGIRVYVPVRLRKRVLEELHASHFGIVRTKALARSYCWWPKVDEDIERMISNCIQCQQQRANPKKVAVHSWEEATEPFERVHIDYAGPFRGKYFFVLVDAFSKWPEVHIVPNMTAQTTINVCRQIFSTFGLPITIVSDHGTQFNSREFQHFLQMNGIEHRQGAPYHPATNGLAERFVRTFKEKLKKIQASSAIDLQCELWRMLLTYRKTAHAKTGKSPAVSMFNRQIRSRIDLMIPTNRKTPNQPIKGVKKFEVGERVGAREYLSDTKWYFGTISQVLGNRHYTVVLDDGRVWKRHVDQLNRVGNDLRSHHSPSNDRTFDLNAPTLPSSSTDLDEPTIAEPNAQNPQISSNTPIEPAPIVTEVPVSSKSTTPQTAPLRRSARIQERNQRVQH